MNMSFMRVYLAVTLGVFLLIVALVGIRILVSRDRNSNEVSLRFDRLSEVLQDAFQARRRFDSEVFTNAATTLVNSDRNLHALTISSNQLGIMYAYSTQRRYLNSPAGDTWTEPVVFRYSRITDRLYRGPFSADDSTLWISGLYRIFGRTDLYPIVRDGLFILLVFLIIAAIVPLARLLVASPPRHGSPQPGVPTTLHSSLFNRATNLVRRDFLLERLRFELERAGGYDLDLTLVFVGIDDWDGLAKKTEIYRQCARVMQRAAPLADLVFEWDNGAIAAIMPETDLDSAIVSIEAVRKAVERSPKGAFKISAGLSDRNGRIISERRIFVEAYRALEKASREGGNQIVAFRADPVKFRNLNPDHAAL